jgi:hypothetical protein
MHKETCKMGMVCGDKCVKTSCKLCTSIVKWNAILVLLFAILSI